MESHPYAKPRGVGPVTTQLTPGAEHASSKAAGAPGAWSCSPTCRAWSESSRPSLQIQRARVRAVLAAVQYGCGLYLQPVQYGYGLYLEPVQYGCGLYLEPVQ